MISALFYLYTRSVKNRLVTRVKRLKQPKYLFGAIAGGLYFYFYVFRFVFQGQGFGRRGSRGLPPFDLASPDVLAGLEWGGALLALVFVLLAWLLPKQRAALDFTEAEIAFLFPAPVSRAMLIHFKLIRSQLRILISALFFTLVSARFGGSSIAHAVGWWVILSTLNLHYLGSSFVQTLLFDRGFSTWQRRLVVLGVVGALLVGAYAWGHTTFYLPTSADLAGPAKMAAYAKALVQVGPLPYVLLPFRLLVRPFLAPNAGALLIALGPALLLLALHYWWVMRMDVSFEEASIAAAQKRATLVTALRTGNRQLLRPGKKRKKPLFMLQPIGPRVLALFWKNLIVADQAMSFRFWAGAGLLQVGFCWVMGSRGGGWEVLLPIAAAGSLMALGWTVLFGPQILRQDFRQDLAVADVLKQYPLSGWQIVLGELLAPTVILTAVQWSLILVALIFSGALHGSLNVPLGVRIATALGMGLITPALSLLCLLLPNAAVLLFPGWFRQTGEPQQGLEVTGQRLIMVFGHVLVLIISLLPASAVFAGIFFLVKYFAPLLLAIPLAAMAATAVLVVEAGAGIVFLGRLFERLDVSAEN